MPREPKTKGFLESSSPVASDGSVDHDIKNSEDVVKLAKELTEKKYKEQADKAYAEAKASVKKIHEKYQHAMQVTYKQELNSFISSYSAIRAQDTLRAQVYDEIIESDAAVRAKIEEFVTWLASDRVANQKAVEACQAAITQAREGELKTYTAAGVLGVKKGRKSDATLVGSGNEDE